MLKHGQAVRGKLTKEYNAWRNMKARCYSKNDVCYYLYGERGIKVCKRWLDSFTNFTQDMGPAPTKYHSLDRIDNNRDYEPSNCKWSTASEQQRNKRNNSNYTYNGKTMCLSAWSAELGINRTTLKSRLKVYGWPIERAFAEPVGLYFSVKNKPEKGGK